MADSPNADDAKNMLNDLSERFNGVIKSLGNVQEMLPNSPIKPVTIDGIKANAHISFGGAVVLTFENNLLAKELYDKLK